MSNAVSLRTPKYRRHKAKGLALVTINGRDIYLGKYNSEASRSSGGSLRSICCEIPSHPSKPVTLGIL